MSSVGHVRITTPNWIGSNSYSTLKKTNMRVPVADLTEKQLQRIKTLDEGNVSVAQYKKILKQVESPEELHKISQGYNWDDGYSLLIEMVKHEMCDGGTALEIYWLGQPDYYSGHKFKKYVPSFDVKGFSFLKKIEKLYAANEFASSEIKYDPSGSYNESLWQCLVKYSGVPDNMLMMNYGDRKKNQNTLEEIRKNPDDLKNPETLKFLANTYYKNKRRYSDMLDCARRLLALELDNELYRAHYTQAMEHVKIALNNESVGTEENFTDSEKQNFYLDYIQLKENDIAALEKEIDGEKEVPEIKHNRRLMYSRIDLADLYKNVKNHKAAIAIYSQLLDQARSDKKLEHKERSFLIDLAEIYQEIEDFDNATNCVDKILDGDETGFFYFCRYNLLSSMGKSEQAEALLDKRLERLERERISAEQEGNPTTRTYTSIAETLEKYKKDYHRAAVALQPILEKKLYFDSTDRKKFLDGIKLLKQSMPSQIRY